jgi:two-component system response regulator AlgR
MAESPLRVLIVDDEGPARHRLRELLDDCAAVLPLAIVGEAQHGREALDILHSAPADLVLTDITCRGWTVSSWPGICSSFLVRRS